MSQQDPGPISLGLAIRHACRANETVCFGERPAFGG